MARIGGKHYFLLALPGNVKLGIAEEARLKFCANEYFIGAFSKFLSEIMGYAEPPVPSIV